MLEIKYNPAKNSIDRFEFFKKNLIPKISITDQYTIEKQIPIDKNSSRKDYWPRHITEVNNERL